MEIGIVAKRGNPRATEVAGDIRAELVDDGVSVVVDEATGAALGVEGTPVTEMAGLALVVSVGGDGTFLFVARNVGPTPMVGVNLGEVGFLNAVAPAEATDRVAEEVERIRERGEPRCREVPRIVASGEGWSLPPGLNEVVVQGPQRGRSGGLDAEIRIDGSLYGATHADGVLIATPTGSTAYNLSERGPLVHPDVGGLIVNEMAPVEPMPPLVVEEVVEVTVRASGADRVAVVTDGSERRWLDPPATVSVGVHEEPGLIAGPRTNYFRALEKLHSRRDGSR